MSDNQIFIFRHAGAVRGLRLFGASFAIAALASCVSEPVTRSATTLSNQQQAQHWYTGAVACGNISARGHPASPEPSPIRTSSMGSAPVIGLSARCW